MFWPSVVRSETPRTDFIKIWNQSPNIYLSLSPSWMSLDLTSSCCEMKEVGAVKLFGTDCLLKIGDVSRLLFAVMSLKSPLSLTKANSNPVFGSKAIWLSGWEADIEAINSFAYWFHFYTFKLGHKIRIGYRLRIMLRVNSMGWWALKSDWKLFMKYLQMIRRIAKNENISTIHFNISSNYT